MSKKIAISLLESLKGEERFWNSPTRPKRKFICRPCARNPAEPGKYTAELWCSMTYGRQTRPDSLYDTILPRYNWLEEAFQHLVTDPSQLWLEYRVIGFKYCNWFERFVKEIKRTYRNSARMPRTSKKSEQTRLLTNQWDCATTCLIYIKTFARYPKGLPSNQCNKVRDIEEQLKILADTTDNHHYHDSATDQQMAALRLWYFNLASKKEHHLPQTCLSNVHPQALGIIVVVYAPYNNKKRRHDINRKWYVIVARCKKLLSGIYLYSQPHCAQAHNIPLILGLCGRWKTKDHDKTKQNKNKTTTDHSDWSFTAHSHSPRQPFYPPSAIHVTCFMKESLVPRWAHT